MKYCVPKNSPTPEERRKDALERFRRYIPSLIKHHTPKWSWLIKHSAFANKRAFNFAMRCGTRAAINGLHTGKVNETIDNARTLHRFGEWERFDFVIRVADKLNNTGVLRELWKIGTLGGHPCCAHNLSRLYIQENEFKAAKRSLIVAHRCGLFKPTMALYALYAQNSFTDKYFSGKKVVGVERNPVLALHFLTEAADISRRGMNPIKRLKYHATIRVGAAELIKELRETRPDSKVLQKAESRFTHWMRTVDACDKRIAPKLA